MSNSRTKVKRRYNVISIRYAIVPQKKLSKNEGPTRKVIVASLRT